MRIARIGWRIPFHAIDVGRGSRRKTVLSNRQAVCRKRQWCNEDRFGLKLQSEMPVATTGERPSFHIQRFLNQAASFRAKYRFSCPLSPLTVVARERWNQQQASRTSQGIVGIQRTTDVIRTTRAMREESRLLRDLIASHNQAIGTNTGKDSNPVLPNITTAR